MPNGDVVVKGTPSEAKQYSVSPVAPSFARAEAKAPGGLSQQRPAVELCHLERLQVDAGLLATIGGVAQGGGWAGRLRLQ